MDGVSDVYRYDGDGNRVRKNFATGEKVRMVYSGGQLIAEYDLSTGALLKEYVYGAKGLVATIEPANGTRYTTADHLGSPRVVTNSSAGVVSRHDYLPFGAELGVGIGGRTTGMGFSVTDGVRQKFTSKERDAETGLDYFLARYYSSPQGRFTSPDEFTGGPDELFDFVDNAADNPMFYAELDNPQSLNKYQYTYNNPLRYVDPDGHDPLDQDPKCGCGPTPAQIDALGKQITKALDWVADTTRITALADTIRENGPAAARAAGNAVGNLLTKIGEQGENPCNECVIQQTRNTAQTAEKTKNVADAQKKGIPEGQLGPSGKPKVHVVNHPTEKRAKDAARNQGQGKPVKDARPKKGGPHYHPTNRDGSRKKGTKNIHHEYPE